jgi:RNA polymerase sigma factor (TIGR02999 family)
MSHDSAENVEITVPGGTNAGVERSTIDQNDLLTAVYDELRSLARHFVNREMPGQTLTATALVHEAYLRLSQSDHLRWEDDRHFYLAAAQAMRRILVDRARRKRTRKRGGGLRRVSIAEAEERILPESPDLVRIDEALSRFALVNERASQVIMLRFFAGLENEHAARLLGISAATAMRDWQYARAWLLDTMGDRDEHQPER